MSQFLRVVSICKGSKYYTLREIENLCRAKFGENDTQAAISARLREADQLTKLKLKKDRIGPLPGFGKKRVYKYRLTQQTTNS